MRRASSSKLHTVVKVQRGEARHVQNQLQDIQSKCGFVRAERLRVEEQRRILMEQCESLSHRCRSEHQSALEAVDAAAQSDEAWQACEREREELRAEHKKLSSHLAAFQEELAVGREHERHRKASLRALEEKVTGASRSLQAAERRAEAQHEEVCGTVRQVALFREKEHAARHTLLRREAEVREEDEQLCSLRTESQQRGQEVAAASQVLQQLRESQDALEAALRENVALWEHHRAVAEIRHRSHELDTCCEGQQQDVQGRLAAATEKVEVIEADCARWRQRLESLRREHVEAEARKEILETDSRGAGTVGATLQEELQRIFLKTEQLRSEHDEVAAACDELQRRTRTVEPALEASRCRVRELEESLEDVTAEASRARQSKETLMREVSQFRDKMRGLRRRHERLEERSQSSEKRLVRQSGGLHGTAGFAAAAASVASPSHGGRGAMMRTPHLAARNSDREPSPIVAQLADDARSNASQSLGYVRHWIELEEARLNVARTPPMQSPAPSPSGACFAGKPSLDLRRAGLVERSSAGGGNSPPRSAAALAALEAGARPSEVLALLNGLGGVCGEEESAPRDAMTRIA